MQRDGGVINFSDNSYLGVEKKNIHQMVDVETEETFFRFEDSLELMSSVQAIDGEGSDYQKPDLENGEGNLCNVD